MRRHCLRAPLAAATLILAAVLPVRGASDSRGLLDELVRIERQFGVRDPKSADIRDLQVLIQEFVSKASAATFQGNPEAVVSALNRLIFEEAGVSGSQDLKDPDNLFPSRVLERRKGYCVGIAAIYLALSEKLGLPIHAVATPSHVFLRYDDGTTRINIETLQRGANVPDEQYIREEKIPGPSIRAGVFMRNLTTEEFLAQFHNNIGVIYSERKNYERAAWEYEQALSLDPRLPVAHYNYGSDLLRLDESRPAVRHFSKSLRLYPTDAWALNNRGRAYFKMGKIEKARRDFEEALRIDPGFEQARTNLQSCR